MKNSPLKEVAEWLNRYAVGMMTGSYLSIFGRKIKRPKEGMTLNGEIAQALSGLRISGNAEKAFISGRNRRLVCAYIFTEDIGPVEPIDPSNVGEAEEDAKEKVRKEIKKFILTVHDRIWVLPGTAEKIGDREIQNNIKRDMDEVVAELKAIHDMSEAMIGSEDDVPHGNPVTTSYPSPSRHFTGREAELLALSLLAERNDAVFVCGAEGTGRTELCRKFAEGWADMRDEDGNGSPVVWVEHNGSLRSSVAWDLKIKGINESELQDEGKTFRAKLSALGEDPRTLMIVDGLDAVADEHMDEVLHYRFKKIFISGNAGYLGSYPGIEVKALSEEASEEMFLGSLKEGRKGQADGEAVRGLLRSAGYHTLTVALMAAHLNTHGTEIRELLERMDGARADGADGRIRELLRLTSLDDAETDALKVASSLPPSGMDLERFEAFSELDRGTLMSLRDKGMIRVAHIGRADRISVDPQIARALRSEFGPLGDECRTFFGSLEKFFDISRTDFSRTNDKWIEKADLLPVLMSVTDLAGEGLYAPILCSLTGRYLRSSGNSDEALRYYYKALRLKEKIFGATHPSLAPTYAGIGNAYADKWEYDTAVEYYIKALKLSGRMSGIIDPSIASTYNNVGMAYSEIGEYAKAREYYFQALEIRKKVLGPDHPDTAATYNGIGDAYSDGGDPSKALEFYSKALEIRKRAFGKDNYYTAVTYSNIGVAYLHMREYGKALEHCTKAMEILKRTAGVDHPDTEVAYDAVAYIREMMDRKNNKRERPGPDWNPMYS
ncbi:MAG: tetratricopeptide repeat protein [Methanomassiliicoccaceae archaeon]|jgi:tetratricopeptide (TPR) repeat protein|nr:tetratricopeptide repeat protein [Methanomassiliicoccaceae archaeon]